MSKRFIIIASPPACGKTRLAKRLSTELGNVVYLDKDALIPLSKRVFSVAKKPYNRSSRFFNREIRDYEYEVILNIGVEALKYAETVVLNAPFTREVRDPDFISSLDARVKKIGGKLLIVWVVSDEQTCYARMRKRNSDRDRWKLSHWREYVATLDFTPPRQTVGDKLFEYDNRADATANECFDSLLERIENLNS